MIKRGRIRLLYTFGLSPLAFQLPLTNVHGPDGLDSLLTLTAWNLALIWGVPRAWPVLQENNEWARSQPNARMSRLISSPVLE